MVHTNKNSFACFNLCGSDFYWVYEISSDLGGGGVYDKFIYLRNIQKIPKVLLVATLFISDGAC